MPALSLIDAESMCDVTCDVMRDVAVVEKYAWFLWLARGIPQNGMSEVIDVITTGCSQVLGRLTGSLVELPPPRKTNQVHGRGAA